jgi:hypothetical protein
LTATQFLERKCRSSAATGYTYEKAPVKFANCIEVQFADVAADQVNAHKLDAYKALDKFMSYLIEQGLALKSVKENF